MKGVTIIAKTPVGEQAIRQAIKDSKKAPWHERQAYNLAYSQQIIREKPLTFRLEHKTGKLEELIPPESLAVPLKKTMRENGASESDYEVVYG